MHLRALCLHSLLLLAGTACSDSTDDGPIAPEIETPRQPALGTPINPSHGPPRAAGEVCVDVVPETATVTVDGTAMTERCQDFTTTYSVSVEVVVSAPGYVSQTHSAPLLAGTETLNITLVAATDE